MKPVIFIIIVLEISVWVTQISAVCPVGKYGVNCSLSCPPNCKDNRCHPGDGSCDSCVSKFWGKNCNIPCSSYCRAECEQYSGDCDRCKVGYWTENCTVPCPGECDKYGCDIRKGTCVRECLTGYYGLYCNLTCPHGCSACRKESGSCNTCREGYYGTFCNITCPLNCNGHCNKATGDCYLCIDGYWGLNCSQQCPHRCICDQLTGNCSKCKSGFCGQQCEKTCPSVGRCYGYCNQVTCECENCLYSSYMGPYCELPCPAPCYKCNITGSCYGCDRGSKKYGINCDLDCKNCSVDCTQYTGYCKHCLNGTYGPDCEQSCDIGCQTCDRFTGQCLHCLVGYWGDLCEHNCPDTCYQHLCDRQFGTCNSCQGFYGQQCEHRCPTNCPSCDRTTGYCESCPVGFWGHFCNNTCPINCLNNDCDELTGKCEVCDGYYGDKCEQPCPENCLDCFQSNGVCTKCHTGHWGVYCNKTCPENCDGGHCQKHHGTCYNCLWGYWGQLCENLCHSNNCVNEDGHYSCNIDDGFCYSCKTGFWAKDCNHHCANNCHYGCQMKTRYCLSCAGHAYGRDCEIPCPIHCQLKNNDPNEQICDRAGICLYQCQIGWYGPMCNESCVNCRGSMCHFETGICDNGCKDGFHQNPYNTCVEIIQTTKPNIPVTRDPSTALTSAYQNTISTSTVSGLSAEQIDTHDHTLTTAGFVIGVIILLALVVVVIIGLFMFWKKRLRSKPTAIVTAPTVNMPEGIVNLGLELDEPQILMEDPVSATRPNSQTTFESNSSGFLTLGIRAETSSNGYDYLRPTATTANAYLDLNNESTE